MSEVKTEYRVEREDEVFVVYSYVTHKNYVTERLNYPAAKELAELLKLLEKPEM